MHWDLFDEGSLVELNSVDEKRIAFASAMRDFISAGQEAVDVLEEFERLLDAMTKVCGEILVLTPCERMCEQIIEAHRTASLSIVKRVQAIGVSNQLLRKTEELKSLEEEDPPLSNVANAQRFEKLEHYETELLKHHSKKEPSLDRRMDACLGILLVVIESAYRRFLDWK